MNAGSQVGQSEGLPAALDVRDLEVTFHRRGRDLPVLKGVTLRIAPGEAYGLVGESGCGKTTLAMAALRYLAANGTVDAGKVLVEGRDVGTLSDEALRKWRGEAVAMVYQDPATALSPAMRIGDQVAEVFRYHEGMPKAEALKRARESLRRVALPDPDATMRRYPFELSGGQQQRVVIAMALAANPHLLVLDEPTTGLDATVEAEILDLIEELRGRIHASILLITHNLGLVARLCERVGVLYAGRLVEEGPAREVFTDPRHPYTMGLLRCVPKFGMNKTDAALQTIPGTLPALGEPLEGCVYSARCPMAKPVCIRREPDLYAWPGDGGQTGRAEAEAMPPDPAAYSPHHARPVGESARHARCYFSAEVPAMPHTTPVLATSLEARGAAVGDVLEIGGLNRTFKDGRKKLIAVSEVTLSLRRGETFGLVGESGSGKTTLAKCVTGLIAPDSGTVTFEERAPRHRGTAVARGAAGDPDGLPEPRLHAQPRLEHARHPQPRCAQARQGGRGARQGRQALGRRARGATLPRAEAHRPLRAARSSASPSPVPSPAIRPSWSATNRPRPSMCRCRRASSTCWSSCRPASRCRTSSSHTTWRWCATSPTGSA